jgi:hypothetical protein
MPPFAALIRIWMSAKGKEKAKFPDVARSCPITPSYSVIPPSATAPHSGTP